MSRPQFFVESECYSVQCPIINRNSLEEGDIVMTFTPRKQFGSTAQFFCKGVTLDREAGADCVVPSAVAKKFSKHRFAEISSQAHEIDSYGGSFHMYRSIGVAVEPDDSDLHALAPHVDAASWAFAKKITMVYEAGNLQRIFAFSRNNYSLNFSPTVIPSSSTVAFILQNAYFATNFTFNCQYKNRHSPECTTQDLEKLAKLQHVINDQSYPTECKFAFFYDYKRPLQMCICFKYDAEKIAYYLAHPKSAAQSQTISMIMAQLSSALPNLYISE